MNFGKIYDGFLFFNELDILEIRLNTLYDVVDYFILVESSVTHAGDSKEFIFDKNKERFGKFNDKIIHIKVNDTPNDYGNLPKFIINNFDDKCIYDAYRYIENAGNIFNRFTEPYYGRDFYQKECIRRGMANCNDDDIIILSDVDEIPNPEIISRLNEFYNETETYTFNQKMYCYYFNLMCESHINNGTNPTGIRDCNWKGSRMGSYKLLKNYSFNVLRVQDNIDIIDGGWHFSYMGGVERLKQKIKASSAIDWNNEYVMNRLEHHLMNEIDVIGRGDRLIKVPLDETYPKYFLENLEKFSYFIKK